MSATGQRCETCGAQFGERERDCGSLDCPHGECLHNHHDGCPVCDFGPTAERTITREEWASAWSSVRAAVSGGRHGADLGIVAPHGPTENDAWWMSVALAEHVLDIRDAPEVTVSRYVHGEHDPDIPF